MNVSEALEALERLANVPMQLSLAEWQKICGPIRAVLEAKAVDADALKRVCDDQNTPIEEMLRNEGWNDCIDHLAARGLIASYAASSR